MDEWIDGLIDGLQNGCMDVLIKTAYMGTYQSSKAGMYVGR